METQATGLRLLPCERHAAILGRQAARIVQQPERYWALRRDLLDMVTALRLGSMGPCSEEARCVVGDEL